MDEYVYRRGIIGIISVIIVIYVVSFLLAITLDFFNLSIHPVLGVLFSSVVVFGTILIYKNDKKS